VAIIDLENKRLLNDAKFAIVATLNSITSVIKKKHGALTEPQARGLMMMKLEECHLALAAISRLTDTNAEAYEARAEDAYQDAANLRCCFAEGEVIPSGYLSQYFRDAAGNHTPIYESKECN
tara:strand:- start:1231 stop:1596 length:366 start_codon:yes stop_codon:yes gene_type:complete